jgi:hypothetical protein
MLNNKADPVSKNQRQKKFSYLFNFLPVDESSIEASQILDRPADVLPVCGISGPEPSNIDLRF